MEIDPQIIRDSKIRTTCLVILTFIAVAVALYFLRPVLMPFVLALFIASGLVPLLNMVQTRLGSSRPMAIFITALISITATVAMWMVIGVSVRGLWDEKGQYRAGFDEMLARISDTLEQFYPEDSPTPKPTAKPSTPPQPPAVEETPESEAEKPVTAEQTAEVDATAAPPAESTEGGEEAEQQPATSESPEPPANSPDTSEDEDLSPLEKSEPPDTHPLLSEQDLGSSNRLAPLEHFISDRLESIIRSVANELSIVFSSGLLVMIFLFFLLLGGSAVKLPEKNIWRDVDTHVRQYIVTKSVISLFTGLVFGIVLWLFGVPLAFVLGMLAFLLNFIPNLGPIISTLLPVPLVWVVMESTWAYDAAIAAGHTPTGEDPGMSITRGVLAISIAGLVQFISGNVVEPKIMGEQFRLHPIAILLSLMFWYMIWGLVGAFLAVPITSALKIVFAELEGTRPVADLLEGNLSILAKREHDQPAKA